MMERPSKIARRLAFNQSLDFLDSMFFPREVIEKSSYPSWTKMLRVISKCKKCMIIPTLDLFCDKTKCPVAEPSGLSRYCDYSHLSEIGTDRMLPILKDVLSILLQ